jgi:chromosomal replication initiation ATPase DnaA
MGCDYYIDKDLEIYDYNNKLFSSINLEHERGYYWFSAADEDEDGYDTEYAEYIKRKLQPSMKPIVIYSDNAFTKLSSENKYRKLIEDELKTCNKTLNDVQKIIKIEHRYER